MYHYLNFALCLALSTGALLAAEPERCRTAASACTC